MSAVSKPNLSSEEVAAFLYREARLLDDRCWDEWLSCYAPEVVFWMPAWDDDDGLTDDPQRQISLIYYHNREGLEDRVFRIKTERSGATCPEPRTSHNLSNIEILSQNEDKIDLRFNWQTLSHRYKVTDQFFGVSFYSLSRRGEALKIIDKKIILKNDYIQHVIDIYHI